MPMAARGHAKLIEECGELIQVCGKRLAYYRTEDHPDGGPPLHQRLCDEMGDVIAAIRVVCLREGIPSNHVDTRADAKIALFLAWDEDPDNNSEAIDG